MSVSPGSSYFGDGDNDMLLDEEEEIDFYAILNVPRDASDDEIVKAYRKRCLIFHPDRHTDEDDKKEAERLFQNLQKAYETLMDHKKRAIYDALGIQGLETQGWELISRSANPENIRREYEFLLRLKEQELMLQRIHPSGNFVVKTSCVGLFHEDPEERYLPQLLGLSLSQSVDCGITSSDRVGVVGRVKSGNGRGDGSVSLIWKKNYSVYNFENNLTFSSDAVGLVFRASRNVFQRAAVIFQPQIQYSMLQEQFIPALTLIYTMRLRVKLQGSIVLSWSPLNSGITTTLVHTENNLPKVVTNFTLSPANSNIRMIYFRRDPEKDAFSEMACQLSLFGVSPSIHYERKLTRFSRVGCSLQFSFPSCLLISKFKLKTGQNTFEWQLVLCDDRDSVARSALYGILFPLATVSLFKVVFRSWVDKVTSWFDDSSNEKEVDPAKQDEANRVINLMRPTAERIKREEEQKHGIIIVEAKYGQSDVSGSSAYPIAGDKTIDVTIPLQSMVHDSQLRVFSVKSQLPGFYDPCPGEAKMVKVKYLFRDELHAVIVPDEMPLQIPLRSHKLTK
ncbi:unnamed protein product [Auanema sp. JU1783]|nr:unnamed protein product [Auanema sp. JU1783]